MGTIDSIVTGYSSICFFCGKPAEVNIIYCLEMEKENLQRKTG